MEGEVLVYEGSNAWSPIYPNLLALPSFLPHLRPRPGASCPARPSWRKSTTTTRNGSTSTTKCMWS
jgi:hypothetical protein